MQSCCKAQYIHVPEPLYFSFCCPAPGPAHNRTLDHVGLYLVLSRTSQNPIAQEEGGFELETEAFIVDPGNSVSCEELEGM